MDCYSKEKGANEPQITALLGGSVEPVVKRGSLMRLRWLEFVEHNKREGKATQRDSSGDLQRNPQVLAEALM